MLLVAIMVPEKSDSISIQIEPIAKGVTPFDVIQSIATVELPYSVIRQILAESKLPVLDGPLFKVESPQYKLQLGFTQNVLYLSRNNEQVEAPVNSSDFVQCYVTWQPTELRLTVLDRSFGVAIDSGADPDEEIEKRTRTVTTPATLPPNSLVEWARSQLLVPTQTYKTIEYFFQEVVFALQSIQDKVDKINNLYRAFWNFKYGPHGKIVERLPKQEIDIHPTFRGLLSDIAIEKNFKISPDYEIGGGALDFLITGIIDPGYIGSVCVEFKNAHNSSLKDGLLKQLPAYMQAEGCDLGVFCVLWFKGIDFAEPSYSNEVDLKLMLEREADAAGLTGIRVMIFNLSRPEAPSRL